MPVPQPAPSPVKVPVRKLSGIGATEDQMSMVGTVPQRIDRLGTKVEDLAGSGGHDSKGG